MISQTASEDGWIWHYSSSREGSDSSGLHSANASINKSLFSYSTRQCVTGKFGCVGVVAIQVSESVKLAGLLEDLSRRLHKLETVTAKKKNYGHKQTPANRASKKPFVPNAQAKPFIPHNQNDNQQGFFTNVQQASRPYVSPPTLQQNTVQPTYTVNAQVCYYHRTFGDKARLCSKPCSYYEMIGQREVANIASYPAKLLYVVDKGNKCKYLIDTGAAVFYPSLALTGLVQY